MLSAKDLFWLALAGGVVLFVLFLCYAIARFATVLRATEGLIVGVADRTVPLLGEVTTSVVQVNGQLERVDAITSNVQSITTNAASLAGLFAATLGSPLVKVAAFSYGIRRAVATRAKADFEKEYTASRKAGRP
jgi:hypothetical protein